MLLGKIFIGKGVQNICSLGKELIHKSGSKEGYLRDEILVHIL